MNRKSLYRQLLLCALASGCAACATTPPARFYSLPARASAQSFLVDQDTAGLRVGPFSFPDYLRRPNIITRTSSNEITVDEFERWAGSLENDFHRVLASRLQARLQLSQVSSYPADPHFAASRELVGEIVSFEGFLGGDVTLDVNWIMTSKEGATQGGHSVIVVPVQGNDYNALVAAHTQAVEQFGDELAKRAGNVE